MRRDRALWALAITLSFALLIAPAAWNGFPLLQYDTGGYLARWYEPILVPSRAVVYGLILKAGEPLAFWPVVALQAALTTWVIALVLRVHGLLRPRVLLVIIAALSVATTLPWLTAILLTDIFCGLGVLALYLLLMRTSALTRAERIGLMLLIAVSVATHSATLAVLLALYLAVAALCLIGIRAPGLDRGALALVLGAAMVFLANYAVARQFTWTPGGFALSFGRMLQDGIVKKYLDEHCPDPALRLCAVKNELPDDADVWFWGSPLFDKLGRFAGLNDEMQTIALACLAEYPALEMKTAAIATARQLIGVHSGEGVTNRIYHTYAIIDRYVPQLSPALHAARQQRGEISFAAINRLHYPVALVALALMPFIAIVALRRRRDIGELAAAVSVAILANAFVCGALSNPHDRYGARVVWLAVLVCLLALARRGDTRLGDAKKFP